MKSIYWRPKKTSRRGLLLVAIVATSGLAVVHAFPSVPPEALETALHDSAHRAETMLGQIKSARLRRELPIDLKLDPAASGLIGCRMSSVTSRPAELSSKRTTINPNFAAATVRMLWQAGVRPGDTVAVGWTGSFPALNTAVCAAIESMELRALVIASATSSQYGANQPEFMWLDMERELRDAELTSIQSALVSSGGAADRAVGLAANDIDALVARHSAQRLPSTSRSESVRQRMQQYHQLANDAPIRAYINVGGGVASLGGEAGRAAFQPGLNQRVSAEALSIDCVMARFAEQGTPVIHLGNAKQLAKQFDFPIAPVAIPAVGTGNPFQHHHANRALVAAVLATIGGALHVGVFGSGALLMMGAAVRSV